VQNITAGPVMSGEADVELVTVDLPRLRRPTNSSSTIRQTTSEVNRVLPQHRMIGLRYYPVSTLPQKLDQHHRTETDGVHHLSRRAREGFDMPNCPSQIFAA
jgi:hypothetical protein